MIASLWAQLLLDTKPYKGGLNDAATAAATWAKKVAGDISREFDNALSPKKLMRQIVQEAMGAMSELETMGKEVGRETQRAATAPQIPQEQFDTLVDVSKQLGLELENNLHLWGQNTEGAKNFRDAVEELGKRKKNWLQTVMEKEGMEGLLPEAVTDPETVIRRELQNAEIFREIEQEELERQRMDELAQSEQIEADREMEMMDRIRRGRALRSEFGGLRGSVDVPAGGLASIGGFTAGAAISAATIGQQQVRLLEVIAHNTEALNAASMADAGLYP